MTLLNVLRAYNDISTSTGAVGSSVNKDQRDWCQKNFVNERALKESEKVADQLSQLCTKMGINPRTSAGEDSDPILRSLLSGSFNNTAMIQPDGSYRQILGGTVRDDDCRLLSYTANNIVRLRSPLKFTHHLQCLVERSQPSCMTSW